MYYRDLETIPGAKATHDANLAKIAQERLKKVAALKKLKKSNKEKSNGS